MGQQADFFDLRPLPHAGGHSDGGGGGSLLLAWKPPNPENHVECTGSSAVLIRPPESIEKASNATDCHSGESQPDHITFVSEDGKRIWRELKSVFTDHSEAFKKLIDWDLDLVSNVLDPIRALPGLTRDSANGLRYHLRGITPWDLDALLVGLKPKLGQEVFFEQLCPILVLATDWQFTSIRDYAIQTLTSYNDFPIPRIMLSRRAKVPQWLVGSYLDLVLRLAPPTEHEAELLGALSILTVSKIREK
ncbi:hypothetical protein FRB99_004128, partial [Tulasnella sp. 403]